MLLLFSIQWIAHEGRITLTLRSFDVLMTFLCFWSFNTNFAGTIVWIDGACNYFFPLLAVILFLLPYIVSVKFSSVIHLTVDNYYLRGFGFISISV